MSRLTIEIPDEMHKQIKAMAALNGQNIKEFVLSRLVKKEDKTARGAKKPSKRLLAALKEARDPSKLTRYDSVEEMFAAWRKEDGR